MPYFMKKARDPISSYTHFLGAILFGAGAILLFFKAFATGSTDKRTLLSLLAFGCSITALYSASAIYHFCNREPKVIFHLRKLDHSMIYVLIAGTYTPILLAYLEPPKGAAFTAAMWIIAAAGIAMKLCWFNAPRWLTTLLYLLMGWAILADMSIFSRMSAGAICLLVLGGVFYTVGGVIYGLKKPNLSSKLGFHELFHLFVLGGSLFHYLLVLLYIA
ncbi:MAG: hemolysin III family protein [Oscillospiraceae bacterium]|nr:hemolysin III family protein [Oscillospiraceae bacterium]HAG57705.1 hemolysin [Oscillospiraceae bacterium]HCU32746.1 hemolysin [Oscillospiraceae bacterium]